MARVARQTKAAPYAASDSDEDVPPVRYGRGRPPSDDSSDDDASLASAKGRKKGASKGVKAVAVRRGDQENVPPVNGAKRRLSGKMDKRKSLSAAGRNASGVALSPPSTPGPSASRTVSMAKGAGDRPGGHGIAALARAREAGNGSFMGNGTPSRAGGLIISKEVMNTNYEEWMKMATDNKINAQNTWSFALIDYFHDMSLLRNSEAEGGINFQKASCTLDGCVKIWTSRVDSVAVETGKLLSGLAEDAANPAAYGDDEDDIGGGDGEEGDGGRPKRQRAPRTQGSTLVDFNEKIKVKQLDLEFTVDPLFRKTCADFDEGGAAGILMNHLGIDGEMRVVFDAGDATLVDDENDNAGADDDNVVDVTKLKESFLPPLEKLAERSLCPSLASFKFSTSESAGSFDIAVLKAAAADDGLTPAPFLETGEGGAAGDRSADFFDQPDLGGSGGDYGGGEDFFGGGADGDDDESHGGGASAGAGMTMPLGGMEAFDPTRAPHERDIVMAMQDGEAGAGMFDYFDKGFMKNWAGPEHWKLRRTIKKNDQPGAAAPKQRKERQPFSIDFEGEPAQTRKELFAIGSVSTTLPKPKSSRRSRSSRRTSAETEKAKNDYTLPDDMHFNSQQLLRLFLKPKYIVNMRRRGPPQLAPEGEIDENFWAQQAAAAQADAAGAGDVDEDDGPQIPFATQFFNDEGDDVPDFEEEFDNPVGDDLGPTAANGNATVEEEDLIAVTQGQLKRARPEFVNYAKKAKRVDVKKLKENIWRELEDITKDSSVEIPRPQEADEDNVPPPPTQAFTKVLGGLRKLYPQDKMEEISTSFCFICLLHLANEKGLRIQGDATKLLQEQEEDAGAVAPVAGEEDEEAKTALKFVGGLEELNIFKDRAVLAPNGDA